jgi:PAS domain S-box-containing protein
MFPGGAALSLWLAAAAAAPPQVLILNSYHRGFAWTDGETDGMLAGLRSRWPDLDPWVEYLDAKRIPEGPVRESLLGYLHAKYRDRRPALVLVTDDAALELALAHREDALGGAPIVFCGVNGYRPGPATVPGLTGVTEEVDLEGTLGLAAALQPSLREVVVLLDRTATSEALRPALAALAVRPAGPALRLEADLSWEEAGALVAGLDPDRQAVLLASMVRDRAGRFRSYEEAADLLAAGSAVPAYGLWDFQLGHGIVGGSLLSGTSQGRRAAELALRVLDGEQEVPIDRGAPPLPAVSWAEATRRGLDPGRLPPALQAAVRGRPESAWHRHRAAILAVAAVMALLSALAVALAAANRRLARSRSGLLQEEERSRSIVEAVSDALFVHDARTGQVIDVNARACELYGHPREALLGHDVGQLSEGQPPHTAGEARRWMERAAREGSGRFEWRARHADGHLFWVEVAMRPARVGGQERVVVSVRDIERRKAAERELQESERRFREIAELLPQVVFEADVAGRLDFVNQRAFDLFGYAPSDLEEGLNALQMIAPQDRERAAGNLEAVARGQAQEVGHEYQARRKDGSTFPVVVFSTPVRRGGRPCGLRGIIIDLSERQRAEAERERFQQRSAEAQRMEAIGRLAGGIAHDFNNLLTPILAYAEELRERLVDDPEAVHDAAAILEAAERASHLTRQILAFSRRQVLALRPLDLNQEVRALHQLLRRLIGEDVEVRLRLDPAPCLVRGDPAQLQQVLMNLAVNARDAMPAGGTLVIETRRVRLDEAEAGARQGLSPGLHVVLEVTDDGVGMPEEVQRHVFEPFYTTKAQGKGTGLGLATAHGIVKQHGGDAAVRSVPGAGTTFTFWFPAEAGLPAQSALPEAATPAAGRGRVLLVEDEPVVRRLVESVLRGAGYEVVAASDGQEALRRAADLDGPFDLLLTDVVMPGMSGRELRDVLVAERPGLRALFISGYPAMPGAPGEVIEGGRDPFLAKPFTGPQLLRAVAEALAARAPTGEA